MRLSKLKSKFLITLLCVIAPNAVCFAQGTLVDVDPHPGVLYCNNAQPSMQCTDDAGVTWHDIEYFRGRYRKGVVLSNTGKATSETVPVPAPEPEQKKPPVIEAPLEREVMLGVQINGRPAGDFARLLQGDDGKLYVPADLIRQWRLQVFQGRQQTFNGQKYFALDDINGVRWQIDPQSQTLSLTVLPGAFAPTNIDASYRQPVEAAHPDPGAFLNHQLVYSHIGTNTQLAGLFEPGFFSSLGVLTSEFAVRDFTTAIQPIRLETKLAREFPDRMALLNLGDSITASNSWSRQVTYAGVSWSSDFATRPSFIPVVLPNLVGQAAQPSTVDVYVNGVRTLQQSVNPGPFTVSNVPVITSQGELQVVITDVLGRQQVISQPFISAQELLRPGVNAYTYEGGILRRNFGLVSSEYGSLFVEGQERHGFTENFTADGRLEISGRQQTGSLGADYGIKYVGIVGGGVALSESGLGPGGLAYIVMERRARRLGYSGTIQVASSTFQQLGMAPGERAPKVQAQFQVTQALGSRTTFAVGYLRQENRPVLNNAVPARPDFAGITGSASVRVGSRMYLAAAVNLSNSFHNASSATFSLVVPLGKRTIVSSSTTLQQDGSQLTTTEYSRQPPIGNGYGYRVRSDIGSQGNEKRVQGDLTYQTNVGSYEAEVSEVASQISTRFTETGGFVMLGGHVVPSPWLNNSFALVETKDMSGVKIFENNQYIATTGWHGLAVLPGLAAYSKNVVRLDDQAIPVDLDVDLTEKTVVPMSRTGVLVKFKALHLDGALLQLVTEKGDPVPSNAEVTVGEFGTIYNTALRGEVFIPNISFPAHVHVHWADQRCDATVVNTNTREPLPRIGPVTCKAVQQ